MNDQDIEQAIQAKGLTAPRVTPADIKALMDRIVYTFDVRPNGSTTTLAHAFLDGDFYLATGVSACVSVENFDAELGKDIAIAGAKAAAEDKLWELEGYALRKRLAAAPKAGDRDALLKSAVDRFLCWDLPNDFAPDCHVSFDRDLAKQGHHSWPTGTNLLTAEQALAMFRHCLLGCGATTSPEAAHDDDWLSRLQAERHEVAERLAKLREFMAAPKGNPTPRQLTLLAKQERAMSDYVWAMDARSADAEAPE